MTVLVSAPWGRYKNEYTVSLYTTFNDYRLLTNNLYFGYYPLFAVSIIVKSLCSISISMESPLSLFIVSQSYEIVNKNRRSFNPAAI